MANLLENKQELIDWVKKSLEITQDFVAPIDIENAEGTKGFILANGNIFAVQVGKVAEMLNYQDTVAKFVELLETGFKVTCFHGLNEALGLPSQPMNITLLNS